MRRVLLTILLSVALSFAAMGQGVQRLERISRHYSAIGNYKIDFELRIEGTVQRGELVVSGRNSYMRIGDTEVFVVDSVRYEVRRASKEIVIDRADLYEKELLNPTSGFESMKGDYNIEECVLGGTPAIRLTPKKSGETIYIFTASDGVSIEKAQYVAGENRAELVVLRCQKDKISLPKFSKDSYKGFETIDFR